MDILCDIKAFYQLCQTHITIVFVTPVNYIHEAAVVLQTSKKSMLNRNGRIVQMENHICSEKFLLLLCLVLDKYV